MSAPKLPDSLAQQAVDVLAQCKGNKTEAAKLLNLPRETFVTRLRSAVARGITPNAGLVQHDSIEHLRHTVSNLERELRTAREDKLNEETIRRKIVGLAQNVASLDPPMWLDKPSKKASAPGVPTLLCSDWHFGEVVAPSQIGGVNKFDLKIAKARLDKLASTTVHLLSIISPKLEYPGIVIPLGGDMISGNIHEELTATNEINTMPTVLELYGELVAFIGYMADHFGNVFLPCVTGNHGRDTRKIWSKDRHHTSFDWLLYCFLAKHFEHDSRVTFYIPDGPDAHYRIYSHRYLLTHGDQFRGGDGMIGALGPIIRGDHKKRSRNGQIDMGYDTMLLGHFHQYIHLERLIVNGSLKGYDEYAYSNNFGFEIPQQALWLTHPQHRMTYRMPVHLEQARDLDSKASWVSVGGAK